VQSFQGSLLAPLLGSKSVSSLYVRLLCRFQPSEVLPYLQANDSYDIDACLKDCLEYDAKPAAAFLLERKGDVQSALEIYLEAVGTANADLVRAVKHHGEFDNHQRGELSDVVTSESFLAAKAALDSAVAMCVRFSQDHQVSHSTPSSNGALLGGRGGSNSTGAPEPVRQVWLQVLQRYVGEVRSLRHEEQQLFRRGDEVLAGTAEDRPLSHAPTSTNSSSTESSRLSQLQKIFMVFVEDVIGAMTGHVDLQGIATAVLDRHGEDQLGDFRGALLGLLGACSFERTVLNCASRITGVDSVGVLRGAYRRCMRPTVVARHVDVTPVGGANDESGGSGGLLPHTMLEGSGSSFVAIQTFGQEAWAKATAAAGPAATRLLGRSGPMKAA